MIKRCIYIMSIIFVLFFLVFNILMIFNLPFLGFRIFRIASGSMEPTLNINSLIIIKKSSEYHKNDIVTYKNENEYITHRIVSIDENEIITKGDANNVTDDPITEFMIVGKLVYVFPSIKFINYMLSKPFTWILIFLLGIGTVYLETFKKQ